MVDAEQAAEPAPPPVATITIAFAPGTLDASISTTGIIGNSHLWTAAKLLELIGSQLWTDGQNALRARAMQERAAVQQVARGLTLERSGRKT